MHHPHKLCLHVQVQRECEINIFYCFMLTGRDTSKKSVVIFLCVPRAVRHHPQLFLQFTFLPAVRSYCIALWENHHQHAPESGFFECGNTRHSRNLLRISVQYGFGTYLQIVGACCWAAVHCLRGRLQTLLRAGKAMRVSKERNHKQHSLLLVNLTAVSTL